MRTDLTLSSVVAHLLLSVAGPYGFGTWVGKALAQISRHDRAAWGDIGGIMGGTVGFAFFIGSILAAAAA